MKIMLFVFSLRRDQVEDDDQVLATQIDYDQESLIINHHSTIDSDSNLFLMIFDKNPVVAVYNLL